MDPEPPHSAASTLRRKFKPSINGLGAADGHSSSSNHRQSLAFELAAAMEPEETDQSSILDQLGLVDEEEADQVEFDDEDQCFRDIDDYSEHGGEDDEFIGMRGPSDLDDPDRLLAHSRSHSRILIHSPRSKSGNPSLHSPSPTKSSVRNEIHATPSRKLRKAPSGPMLSTAGRSPQHSFHELELGLESSVQDLELNSIAPEEKDGNDGSVTDSGSSSSSDQQNAAEVLEAGLASTAKFLTILRQSNTDAIPSSNGSTISAQATSLPSDSPGFSADRQPVAEKLISDLIRTMTDHVRSREGQIRELKEIEIALSKIDRRILAELDELPACLETHQANKSPTDRPEDESESLEDGDDELHDKTIELEDLGLDVAEEDEDEGGRSTPTATSIKRPPQLSLRSAGPQDSTRVRTPRQPGQSPSADAPQTTQEPLVDLIRLKQMTKSLIDSLNQINEHTQIHRQTQTDVARKLKGVRGLVANWKNDNESIENSKQFIYRWEKSFNLIDSPTVLPASADQVASMSQANGKKIRGLFQVEIDLAINETEELLNNAFLKAADLLKVEF